MRETVLVGVGLLAAGAGLLVAVAARERPDDGRAELPVEEYRAAAVHLSQEPALHGPQARVEVIGGRGHGRIVHALERVERALLVDGAFRSPAGIANNGYGHAEEALAHQHRLKVTLQMLFEPDVFGDHLLQAQQPSTAVDLTDHAARVAAEVLAYEEGTEAVRQEPAAHVEVALEAFPEHRRAGRVVAELRVHITPDPVDVVGARRALVIEPSLRNTSRVVFRKLDRLGRLRQPL